MSPSTRSNPSCPAPRQGGCRTDGGRHRAVDEGQRQGTPRLPGRPYITTKRQSGGSKDGRRSIERRASLGRRPNPRGHQRRRHEQSGRLGAMPVSSPSRTSGSRPGRPGRCRRRREQRQPRGPADVGDLEVTDETEAIEDESAEEEALDEDVETELQPRGLTEKTPELFRERGAAQPPTERGENRSSNGGTRKGRQNW